MERRKPYDPKVMRAKGTPLEFFQGSSTALSKTMKEKSSSRSATAGSAGEEPGPGFCLQRRLCVWHVVVETRPEGRTTESIVLWHHGVQVVGTIEAVSARGMIVTTLTSPMYPGRIAGYLTVTGYSDLVQEQWLGADADETNTGGIDPPLVSLCAAAENPAKWS